MSLASSLNTTFQFDQATKTTFLGQTNTGSACYHGQASDQWVVGSVPNVSGYVVSLLLDSVLRHFEQRFQKHPISLHCFFFGKTLPGNFIVEIEDLKTSGKGYCVCRASLKQYKDVTLPLPTSIHDYNSEDFITKVHGLFTMGNMETEQGRTYYHKNPKAPSRDKLVPTNYFIMGDLVNAKVDPSTFPRMADTGDLISERSSSKDNHETVAGQPELSQCMSFADGRPIDMKSLAYWSDMFLTPPFLLGPSFWGGNIWCPTMELSIQFKGIPSNTSEILAHFKVPHIINNRFDLDGELFDGDGNLLALTRHQCLVVDWSRNTKTTAKM
ncbi:thioesterase-like superfamily-domain-containing protein [Halteromyces radiatus]|uniref:thioesterase-like superfamily-domain-containing protein n=1 Tax=Halteromyces radiatus TaxID=101107 RepID=UPI00221F86B5|nr:thioesterase-like superfamily-domain-containing protein [Halteromyces radiatus]KAI8093590.1 thioesterase-like superfamily-domain-containing protein [Halteromyces radiatus]